MNREQYSIVCARRQAFDSLVWQVPSLAIAGQSFLLATALDSETEPLAALLASILSVILGLASFQLMQKHRQLEFEDSERLVRFENDTDGFEQIHGGLELEGLNRSPLIKLSSFKIWSAILLLFVVAGILATLMVFQLAMLGH